MGPIRTLELSGMILHLLCLVFSWLWGFPSHGESQKCWSHGVSWKLQFYREQPLQTLMQTPMIASWVEQSCDIVFVVNVAFFDRSLQEVWHMTSFIMGVFNGQKTDWPLNLWAVSENNPQHFETTSNFVAQLVILRSESDNSILNLK